MESRKLAVSLLAVLTSCCGADDATTSPAEESGVSAAERLGSRSVATEELDVRLRSLDKESIRKFTMPVATELRRYFVGEFEPFAREALELWTAARERSDTPETDAALRAHLGEVFPEERIDAVCVALRELDATGADDLALSGFCEQFADDFARSQGMEIDDIIDGSVGVFTLEGEMRDQLWHALEPLGHPDFLDPSKRAALEQEVLRRFRAMGPKPRQYDSNEEVLADLRSGEREDRRAALVFLELNPETVTNAPHLWIDELDPGTLRGVLARLRDRAPSHLFSNSPALSREIRAMVASDDRSLKLSGAFLAGALGEAGGQHTAELRGLLRDRDPTVVNHALEALGDIGPNASGALQDVVAQLQIGHEWLRRSAASTFVSLGAEAAARVGDASLSADARDLVFAEVLRRRKRGDKPGRPGWALDPAFASAVGELADESPTASASVLTQKVRDGSATEADYRALVAIATGATLDGASGSRPSSIHAAESAVQLMTIIDDIPAEHADRALPALREALRSDLKPLVLMTIVKAIGRFGPAGKPAIPELEAAMENPKNESMAMFISLHLRKLRQ